MCAPAAHRGLWPGTHLEGRSQTKGKLRPEEVSWGPRASSRSHALTPGEGEPHQLSLWRPLPHRFDAALFPQDENRSCGYWRSSGWVCREPGRMVVW